MLHTLLAMPSVKLMVGAGIAVFTVGYEILRRLFKPRPSSNPEVSGGGAQRAF